MRRISPLAVMALPLLQPAATASVVPQWPGPSGALFKDPYYGCLTNYYVSTTGSDAGNGSITSPWATLQHANNELPSSGAAAGTCVNVEPGTYGNGVLINAGGNLASSTGYVVYRCQTLDGCTITDPGNQNSAAFDVRANYVMIDGFNLAASSATFYGQGVEVFNGTNNFTFTQHHIWVLNNLISGYGQSGLQMNEGEYLFAVHNKIIKNSSAGCQAQGSGISIANPIAIPGGYTPTADDLSNKIVGSIGNGFHIVIEWNQLYNNSTTKCGTQSNPYDTDGNNIIFDTWSWQTNCNPAQPISGSVPYTGGGLIAFNVVYNAGGAGIATDCAVDVTIANNSIFNNDLDPYNNGSDRGGIRINNQGASASTYGEITTVINNISVAIPAGPQNCHYFTTPYAQWNNPVQSGPGPAQTSSDYFSNNITQSRNYPSCYNGNDYQGYRIDGDTGSNNAVSGPWTCVANKCGTDPLWVNVGITSVGSENIPPFGANFALQTTSPAIGAGLSEPYLPAQSVDVGACWHTLTICP